MEDINTPAGIAGETATITEALDLGQLAVIGVIDSGDGTRALIRSARGGIETVGVGERAFGYQVTAIGENQVLLTGRTGQTEALTLPTG